MPTLKVILKQDIESLGKKGDVKNVSVGYARNLLLPKQMVILATNNALKDLDQQKTSETQKAEEDLHIYQELASKIDGFELEIPAKVGKDNKLFGSIAAAQIVDELNKNGFNIKKEHIALKNPIKEAGEYDVNCELPHGLEAKIKVIVVEEPSEP